MRGDAHKHSRYASKAIVLVCILVCGSGALAGEEDVSAKVMFSGHSLLDNPLPDWVERIVRSKDGFLKWEEQIVIGSPVRVRTWGDGGWSGYRKGKNRGGDDRDIAKELRQPQDGEPYDALVLAESHSVLGAIIWEDAVGYLRHFHDRFTEGNPAGRTFYYHAWLDIDKTAPTAWLEHEKNSETVWQCIVDRVNLSLSDEERPATLQVMPAGEALTELVRRILSGDIPELPGSPRQQLDRVFSDDVHMTELGAYYLAALHYAVLFGETPEGAAAPSHVSPKLALALQRLAWFVARRHRDESRSHKADMSMCRTEIAEKACASYWTLKGEPAEIGNCRSFFSSSLKEQGGNPFIWPVE
nr:hypothetical protein RTCK_00424 [Rhizobium sp. TCK]